MSTEFAIKHPNVSRRRKTISESKLVRCIREEDLLHTCRSARLGEACIDNLRYGIFSHAHCGYIKNNPGSFINDCWSLMRTHVENESGNEGVRALAPLVLRAYVKESLRRERAYSFPLPISLSDDYCVVKT